MYHHTQLVELRIDRFVRERLDPAIYRATVPMSISAWEVPDEPVPFTEAVGQTFRPFAIGKYCCTKCFANRHKPAPDKVARNSTSMQTNRRCPKPRRLRNSA